MIEEMNRAADAPSNRLTPERQLELDLTASLRGDSNMLTAAAICKVATPAGNWAAAAPPEEKPASPPKS